MFTGQPDRPEVADWCFGYTCGVELDEEAWDAMPDDLQDLLDLIDTYGLLEEAEPHRFQPTNFRNAPTRSLTPPPGYMLTG